ncbi:MAG: hypothetical protein U1C71_03490, partial [archaeon]|nr:hypothetical protein [archaeon]
MGLLGKPKASVDIQIDTYQFSPGDTVKGMVLVTINDAVTPKNLSITLDGSDLVSGYSFGRNTYQRIPLFHFILPLEKEKAFT